MPPRRDSESLRRFKDGPYGSADSLAWFWNSYLAAGESRTQILVSPLQATLADLEGLPPASSSWMRTMSCKTRARPTPTSCVMPVSRQPPSVFNGTIHDFMRLNALRDSESTHAAISLAVAALRRAFGTE